MSARQANHLLRFAFTITLIFCFSSTCWSQDWTAKFTKHPDNPVLSGLPETIMCASDPTIIKEGDTYHMYYTDNEKVVNEDTDDDWAAAIAHATSKDCVHWKHEGIVIPTKKDAWDEATETSFIWKEPGKDYHLFYGGYDFVDGGSLHNSAMGLRISKDHSDYKPHPESPVLKRTQGYYDEANLFSMDIVKEDDTYYMIYTGWAPKTYPNYGIGIIGATSKDLIHWEKKGVVLQRDTSEPYRSSIVSEACLVKGPNGKYYLFFCGEGADEKNRIYVAEGPKPFGPWDINSTPLINQGEPDAWDGGHITCPEVIIEDNTVKLWYAGWKSDYTQVQIGYATASWPLRVAQAKEGTKAEVEDTKVKVQKAF